MSSIPNTTIPVSIAISLKNLLISFFSCRNRTFEREAADFSIASLNPVYIPYVTSTSSTTLVLSLWSKRSLSLTTVLKSANPAKTIPVTLHWSFVMNSWVAYSHTFRTKLCLDSYRNLENLTDDWPPFLCFLGRSTENLYKVSLAFPYTLPYKHPEPSTIIKPNLSLSSSSSSIGSTINLFSHL